MKKSTLSYFSVFLFFLSLGVANLFAQADLDKSEVNYINHLTIEITDGIEQVYTLVTRFFDLEDKQPLKNYLLVLQDQMKDLRRVMGELKSKKRSVSPGLYRQSLDQTITILHNLNVGLIAPIHKCLMGKQTRAPLSVEDRADLLAAALKVSIDEFHANYFNVLVKQITTLHSQLQQLHLVSVAQKIDDILQLLNNANAMQNQSLTEEEKIKIRKAILLKLKLNKA